MAIVIQFVLMTVLAAHLLAANVATAGPFVCMWLQRRAGRGDALAGTLAKQLAGWSVVTLLFAAVTGLMQMMLVAKVYPHVFHATVALIKPSRYYASVGELVFSLVLYGVYYAMVGPGLSSAGSGKKFIAGALALLSGLNTAWHFPTLFALLGTLSTRPEVWGQEISVMKGLADGEVLSLSFHFLFASVAVTGLLLATLAQQVIATKGTTDDRRYVRAGGLLAVVPTVLQIGIGLWLLMETAEPARKMLMGRDTRATVLFLLAVVSALMLMHRLASIALGRQKPNGLRNAWMTLVTTVWIMCAVQQVMRNEQYASIPNQPVPAAVEPAEAKTP